MLRSRANAPQRHEACIGFRPMDFYDWLCNLPRAVQYGVALLMLGTSTWALLVGDMLWPWGWMVGLILLFAACFGRREDEPGR